MARYKDNKTLTFNLLKMGLSKVEKQNFSIIQVVKNY